MDPEEIKRIENDLKLGKKTWEEEERDRQTIRILEQATETIGDKRGNDTRISARH